ncbi:phosphoinositide 3-kinase adapter protein 1 isoform X2 [Microcaecilia unicolor]|uniref:Phosphoinositide 3-kinase adapter protein 1 isoform X2 n=1 Tax=Microcaecilia unicolor TaxID=1415580 RepID=A0A6P7Y2H2_9AMPH|nr:phosphoinositide 3-kinase adapter protein 1 isoform X2 [Microcaecilia unicolor]
MAKAGVLNACDVMVVYGSDGEEWNQYLRELFLSSHHTEDLHVMACGVTSHTPVHPREQKLFLNSRCIIVLLSVELLNAFYTPAVLESLRKVLHPPHKVLLLFCGVSESTDFSEFFHDWTCWKHLSSEDRPEAYISAVSETIAEDSGCESVTDTDAESQKNPNICNRKQVKEEPAAVGNLVTVQPEEVCCGVQTRIYIITRCKLDSHVKTEVEFTLSSSPAVRVLGILENDYTISVTAPDFPSGWVSLTVLAGGLTVCTAKLRYYTNMEQLSNLLDTTTNPIEFMCQAFKIVPYSVETLDKLLTESLKKNIPASGLHVFGINQLEEDDIATNQRDEELPTLLHFSARYGLKNLTALLLTCPGALQAYSVANKHGDFPNNIAEKYGYRDLRQFIDEYVETADLLKIHIQEELMQGEDDDTNYISMANLSTDLLMKCSLNPGCEEDIYEYMVNIVPPDTTEELYEDMSQSQPSLAGPADIFSMDTKYSLIRKFLEGIGKDAPAEEDPYKMCEDDGLYDVVQEGNFLPGTGRPPAPTPRPELAPDTSEKEPFICKVFAGTNQPRAENIYVHSGLLRKRPTLKPRRDRPQSSIYDPFAGMKTPGQRQLITLQEQVKLGIVSVDDAVLEFKEWHLNQKRRSESFRFQQENLKKLRDSITRRQAEKQKKGKHKDLQISQPVRSGQNISAKVESNVYELSPTASVTPPRRMEIRRGNWNTESSSSTASSTSTRSSTRSTQSLSSGVEGDSEDNEIADKRNSLLPRRGEKRPPLQPPRIPPRVPTRPQTYEDHMPPPVPPRAR